jgi:DsbC/DsbD-like thiol-disulfide interchange protein
VTIDCRLLALGLAVLCCAAPVRRVAAQAAATPAGRHVTASLVSQTDAVVPGHALTLGIRLQMQPGWHTYWRNPGDSGLPTRVRWELPTGFEAGELLWPRPARIPTGPLLSFGYEREVVLPVEIRVPATVAGPEVRLAVRVDWLECREECLPGRAALSLALPVRANAAPTPQAGLIAAARALLPVTDDRWTFAAKASGDAVVLAIRPPRGVTVASPWFCPLAPHVLEHAKPPQLAKSATGYRLVLARDPNGDLPARLQGVLILRAGGVERALAVDAKMETAPARGD